MKSYLNEEIYEKDRKRIRILGKRYIKRNNLKVDWQAR
jgi:hypothetical protein